MSDWFIDFLWHVLAVLPWMAFWFFAVNWKNVWPVLKQGAWAACVLLIIMSAVAWSRISPGSEKVLGIVTIGNFWWQLFNVSGLAALALFSGWLQGQAGYEPVEVPLESAEP